MQGQHFDQETTADFNILYISAFIYDPTACSTIYIEIVVKHPLKETTIHYQVRKLVRI
jgi:hypothetical protein